MHPYVHTLNAIVWNFPQSPAAFHNNISINSEGINSQQGICISEVPYHTIIINHTKGHAISGVASSTAAPGGCWNCRSF